MKKLLLIALVLLSCEKKEPEINDSIDFPLLVSLLNKTVQQVKDSFKYSVVSETVVSGMPHIKYSYKPGDLDLTVEIVFINGVAKELTATINSNNLSIARLISDKIQTVYSSGAYSAFYLPDSNAANIVPFTARADYWTYINKGVSYTAYEIWTISQGTTINLFYVGFEKKIMIGISSL